MPRGPFVDTSAKLQKLTISFVMSLCLEQLTSHWVDFPEIWYLSIFWKSVKKIKVHSNPTGIVGTLHEDKHTFMIISCRILLRMKNVSDKSWRKIHNAHFLFLCLFISVMLRIRIIIVDSIQHNDLRVLYHDFCHTFFCPETFLNKTAFEIIWKNTMHAHRPLMTV